MLTEHLTLFWFAMLVNDYKPKFQFRKSSKDAKFGQCCVYICGPTFCYEQKQNRAQNGLDFNFKVYATPVNSSKNG